MGFSRLLVTIIYKFAGSEMLRNDLVALWLRILVALWLRIRLPMQGTQVGALVWEYPTCMEQLSP